MPNLNSAGKMRNDAFGLVVFLFLAFSFAGCGMMSDEGADNADAGEGEGEWDDVSEGEGEGEGESEGEGELADGDYQPPEDEVEKRMSLPVTGKDYVFILNKEVGTLVMIDAATLVIHSIPVGQSPAVLQTIPGNDIALIIDEATDKLLLAVADENRVVAWTMGENKTTRYNTISIAPNGKFAVIYFNSNNVEEDLSPDSLGSLQEVGIVDLRNALTIDELESPIKSYAVGLNPTGVHWSGDGQTAFVVTDIGLTRFDFSSPDDVAVTHNIKLEDDYGDPVDREVFVTPDGHYCLLRRFDSKRVYIVDLETQERSYIEFDYPPTDLNISSDGAMALLVLRENSQLFMLDIPQGFVDEHYRSAIDIPEGAGVVELAPDDDTIILYSTLVETEQIWSYSITDKEFSEHYLQKGVESISFAPVAEDSEELNAVIFHSRKSGSVSNGDDLYEIIDKSFGYTVLNLREEVQVLQITEADQGDFTFTPDGAKGYVIVTDNSDVKKVHILDLTQSSGARISELNLSSVPTGVGVIPGNSRVYVSQEHPDGRITFIDFESDEPITVTGFELNGQID